MRMYTDAGDYLYIVKLYGLEKTVHIRSELRIYPLTKKVVEDLDVNKISNKTLANAFMKMNEDLDILGSAGIYPLRPQRLRFDSVDSEEEKEEKDGWIVKTYKISRNILNLVRQFIEVT